MPKCPGHMRHWFAPHGIPYVRSPRCVRCGAPNPRPLSDEELDELAAINRTSPGWIGPHAVQGLRDAGRQA